MLYRFEDYVLDAGRRELRRGPALVGIEPQVFDLLVFLVTNRDRVVSKENLLASVWGGRIVSESTLDSRINAVRRAIGDTGKDQRLIRTIIGKGVRFVGAVQEPPIASQAATAAAPPRLSIVVLPFASLSDDPEQDYFADAVTDDLTTDLSRISDSFVIARSTAFTYKGKQVDVRQIGRELGVRYVLEGSVRRLGEQVQVNVQLIEAETASHLWAERFDTDRMNLAAAQGEITTRLARTLHLELVAAVGRQIEQEQPANLNARDFVMRGWAWYYKPVTPERAREARRSFEQALAMDPESVDAMVGVALILTENVIKRWSASPDEDVMRAERLLLAALDRDRNHSRAMFTYGMLLGRCMDRLAESQIALEKAIALDRNYAAAMLQLGYTFYGLGQPEAGLPYCEKALQLSPRDQNIVYFYSGMGACHLLLGHADEAVSFFRRARAENPRLWYIHMWLAAALGLRGDIEEAKESLRELIRLRPEINSLAGLYANLHTRHLPQKYIALAEKTVDLGLRRAGMPEGWTEAAAFLS
jgi:adenylate cyclase